MKATRFVSDVNILYLLSHFLGIMAALLMAGSRVETATPEPTQNPFSGLYIFLTVLIATGTMITLYKLDLNQIIKYWYYTAMGLTASIFFFALLPEAVAAAAVATWFVLRYHCWSFTSRNLLETASYAGAGALFGTILGVVPALILLSILALYDIVAVYGSKHMQVLAEGAIETDTFAGFVHAKSDQVSYTDFTDGNTTSDGGRSIGVIGGGDIIMPMIFAISLLPLYGYPAAATSSLGAGIGLYILLSKAEDGKFYPALPAVGGGAVIGFIIFLAISSIL